MLAINNAVNSISRVSMGVLADELGRQNTMIAGVRSMQHSSVSRALIVRPR